MLRWTIPNNPTSKCIVQILFPDECKITFESLFMKRKQLHVNSCGLWLVAGICSHVINLPELTDREHAFDIYCSLLEHKSKSNQSSVNMASSDFCCEEQLKKFSTAEFLIDVLTNSPEKSEYYRELPPKGIRTNLFYITDLTKTSLANISADDIGAYLKSRITNKSYFYGNNQVITVHEVNDKYYCNKRESHNSYSKVYVSADNVVSLHRAYRKAKSFSLTRTIVKIANPINGPMSPNVAYSHKKASKSSIIRICTISSFLLYFFPCLDVLLTFRVLG